MAGLGDILVDQGVLDGEQLLLAQQHAGPSGSLAKALVELRLATEQDLVRALAINLGMPYADVDGADPQAVGLLDEDVARELTALPVGLLGSGEVVVAVADPNDPSLVEVLGEAVGSPVVLALASRRALTQAIEDQYAALASVVAPGPDPIGTTSALADAVADVVGAIDDAPSETWDEDDAWDEPSLNGHETGTEPTGSWDEPTPASPWEEMPVTEPPAFEPAADRSAVDAAVASLLGSRAQPGDDVATVTPLRLERVDEDPSGSILPSEETNDLDLDDLLRQLVEQGGSDLHLTAGIPPAIRVNGDLRHLEDQPVCMPKELQKALYAIMTQKQREAFENELELDLSYAVPGLARFRVNVFQQRDAVGSVMRVIPFEIRPLEELGVPEQVANLAYLPRGFVLVTGPTGSGKSTTLASMIDLINRNRPVHIMTVEDPIEFLHEHKRAVVNQREVGTDTHGFTQALKHVLRQDPDVILVGEMRDLETIQIALTAAETGHLVFGTLHTQDAPQTVDRIIDVFPPHQQEQIRVMLAGALQGVVCQTLLKTTDGNGRTVACEVMMATSGIRNLIREGKTHQIYSAIQAGASHGMIAMDQSLATLVKQGKVSYDTALEKCNNIQEFNRLVGRA